MPRRKPHSAVSERPKLLLVPSFSEVQWGIKPQLEQWAEVASYDPPGVGSEPPVDGPAMESIVERGIAELDRRGWERCVVVGDDIGAICATLVAVAAGERAAGLALGHACLEYRVEGDRPTMSPEVAQMSRRLLELDFRGFLLQDVGVWDRRPGSEGLESGEELVEALTDRVPQDFPPRLLDELDQAASDAGASLDPVLRELRLPLLFAQHEGCVFFTPQGFEEAVEAFPNAMAISTPLSPGLSPEFAEALRELADRLPERRAG